MRKASLRLIALCIGLGGAAVAIDAEAKQCIWNKGAFALKVDWYRPADLEYDDRQKVAGRPFISARRPAVQTDNFPAAQGRCTNSAEVLTAVVNVLAAIKPSNYYANGTKVTYRWGGPMDLPCAADRCEVHFMDSRGYTETYLVVTPPTDRYLDFSGVTLDVKFGPGGPITK